MLPPTFICAAYLSKGPTDLYPGTQKSLRRIDFCFEIRNRKDEGKMNTNSASKKAISMVCLIAGIILLAAALIQDISGSGAGWRGPALIIGAIGILLGMYLFPTLKHHRSIVNFIFVFPLLFTFVVTVIIPLCLGVFYSFTDWNGIKMTGFIGFANYKAMFSEPSFLWSLLITILFVVLNMVLVNVVAFMLALLCTSKVKGLSFFRASYFLPNLIGGIVLGYIWQFVFSRVFVSIGETTGWSLFEISWLSTPNKAFAALVLVSVWQLAGYMILIYVAGFMGLSEDVLEAASIDGASGWVKMKNIILPLMMSSVTICLFLTLSRAFMVYDVNLSLTGGAPYGTTEMAAMHVYEKAFTSRQFGVGQAEAFILFIIVACISGIQVYTTKKREVEA